MLRVLTSQIRTVLRDADGAYRVGGEEFAIILPETIGERALAVAERLREQVAALEVSTEAAVIRYVTISLGVAEAWAGMNGTKALYAAADKALYAAKRAGKNRSLLSSGKIGP